MDLQQMEYVLAVAKYRNFTLAAESCFISQSSLSLQISKLEKELGVRLFDRTTRSIRITEAGQAFVQQATEILQGSDRLRQTMSDYSGLLRGTINIGAITALEKIGFSDLIADFYARYPGLTLNITHEKSVTLLEALERHEIDLAFLAQPPSGSFPNIRFSHMGTDEYVLLVPDSHPLAGRDTVGLSLLKDERFILHHPDQTAGSVLINACKDAGFTPNVVCRIDTSSIALSLIRTGIGIGILPREELDYFHIDGLCRLQLSRPLEKRIVMATLNTMPLSQPVDAFIRFATDRMHAAGVKNF